MGEILSHFFVIYLGGDGPTCGLRD